MKGSNSDEKGSHREGSFKELTFKPRPKRMKKEKLATSLCMEHEEGWVGEEVVTKAFQECLCDMCDRHK